MKKLAKIILVIIILLVIVLTIYYLLNKNNDKIFEYTPEEEITQEDMRKTIVTLYFQNKETKELQTEARLIDSKELLKEPYKKLIMMLIEGPKNETLETTIANNTKINEIEFDKGMVIIDLSEEFTKVDTEKIKEENVIYAIVNTLTELKEVSSIKILIDGEENKKIENGNINFDSAFVRVD